jgi:energy-coupling factor transporter ATP-binding protein EcfA2
VTRWWKCDLQVATPGAKDFRGPSDPPWTLEDEASRAAAATRHLERVRAAGVDVVALADHNDASWIATMIAAGDAVGIVVFPGVEVTTASGADGIHIVIIGERDSTTADFEDILSRVCGFGGDHPRFDPALGTPASAPRTLVQILDELPEGYLAIAPHAFNDNGIASPDTVRGDLRWKALHHDRLGAIDVGDVRGFANPASWHSRFARRELDNFPCLPGLAFVSTSDAYELDRLGERFTWIRMAEPTLEALRQAFLDHEVRIVCDWDEHHPAGRSPNDIGHAWVGRVTMRGLSTAEEPVEVELDPRLTVIIGGRGSGKSSVVAALRLLYGDVDGLPNQARAEFEELRAAVFADAEVEAEHHLAHSGERQTASWTLSDGPRTVRSEAERPGAAATETDFKVRVINQKELYERAAHSSDDPSATSRNLLVLVDDALATGSAGPGGPAAFEASLDEAQTAWISAARAHQSELEASAQRDLVAARVEELRRQVAAFDNPESKTRRERNDLRIAQRDWFDAAAAELREGVAAVRQELDRRLPASPPAPPDGEDPTSEAERDLKEVRDQLAALRRQVRAAVAAALDAAADDLGHLPDELEGRPWRRAIDEAVSDERAYRDELAALGVDPAEYERVRMRLAEEVAALEQINRRLARLPELQAAAQSTWSVVEELLEDRRKRRAALLNEVAERSELLRFRLTPRADVSQWCRRVRDLLNLRADGFLDDVPALGRWLWGPQPDGETQRRHQRWRHACLTGDLADLADESAMRSSWQQRIADLDPILRARLGSEIADDVVAMEFLREDGDRAVEGDWKPLTAGSPGQRSAAMLSFVMHHGVEPLVLDQPEDDLDTEWITQLVVRQVRTSRWTRQLVVVTHNANIPVNADAERVIVLENHGGGIRVRQTPADNGEAVVHVGALEQPHVRRDIQQIMEGGVVAFVRREKRYNNELNTYRAAMRAISEGDEAPETT